MAVTPSGKALPCHAAQTLPGLTFDDVRERPLGDIWRNGAAFNAFRGTDWMKEPCRSCDRREIDFGGCRCQAFAMTGDRGGDRSRLPSLAGPCALRRLRGNRIAWRRRRTSSTAAMAAPRRQRRAQGAGALELRPRYR